MNTVVTSEQDLTAEQNAAIDILAKKCFPQVDEQEVLEDFYTPNVARVLVHEGDTLIGYAGIHITKVGYQDREIKLGGFGGVCVAEDYRNKGIGNTICVAAMEFLKKEGCDIAFLSIDTSGSSAQFYNKFGFEELKLPFTWTNSKGERKSDMGGMIAPLNSKEIFQFVLSGSDSLFVGEGYW